MTDPFDSDARREADKFINEYRTRHGKTPSSYGSDHWGNRHVREAFEEGAAWGRKRGIEEAAKICHAGEQFLKPCCLRETRENARVIRALLPEENSEAVLTQSTTKGT
jgi:hypothetical protein